MNPRAFAKRYFATVSACGKPIGFIGASFLLCGERALGSTRYYCSDCKLTDRIEANRITPDLKGEDL